MKAGQNDKHREKHWKETQDECLAEMKKTFFKPITPNQEIYCKAIETSIITLCYGPAGSGKSFVPCGIAVKMLAAGKIEKIILSRPLVTCGKGIGFLPGELDEKVNPYMRPIFDAFLNFYSHSELDKLIKAGVIEIMPLELMRGSSLKKSFIILDEAENCTYAQLHMFLTRFGEGSKIVINGDISQTDLETYGENPFLTIINRLTNRRHKDISLIKLERSDVVRHPLISFVDEQLDQRVSEKELSPGTWRCAYCPSCKKLNWYDNGDENDETQPDVECVNCWHCKQYFDIDRLQIIRTPGRLHYDDGYRKPC